MEEKLRQRAVDNVLTDKLFVEINDKQIYNLKVDGRVKPECNLLFALLVVCVNCQANIL